MEAVAGTLYEPDETRPAKRVRLEAPLNLTEEVEEEIIDDEDLYGSDEEAAAVEARDVIGEPDLHLTGSEDAARELPNDIIISGSGAQVDTSGFAIPAEIDAEDLYGEGEAETEEGLPAEAIVYGGVEFVAPPKHVDGQDGLAEAMMEETSRVEAEPPGPNVSSADGAQKPLTESTEHRSKGQPAQDHVENTIDGETVQHGKVDMTVESSHEHYEKEVDTEEDFYGALESTLKNGIDKTPAADDHVAPPSRPKDDPEFMQAAMAQKDNKTAEWHFDSSDAESSSSDSSDSSDSDSDSGSDGGYEMLDAAATAKILMSGDGDDDDGKDKSGGAKGPRTTNEVKDEMVLKPDVKVTEDMKITLLGAIDRVVENMALIKGVTPGEYQVLESGSVLCNAAREVIGAVAETFGRVQEPMYSVAFAAKDIEDMGLLNGTQVYYVDLHSSFVFTQPLKGIKGTDASNIHDEEVGEDEIEFSDDEKEAEYKRMKKAAKRGGRGGLTRTDFNSSAHSFGAPGHDSGRTFVGNGVSDAPQIDYGGGMSYDDGDVQEDFYQPLKRPDNLSQLMASAPPPPPSQRGAFDRGRGRGRGRGDRGRGDRGRGRGGVGSQRGQKAGAFIGDQSRGGGKRGGPDQANGQHRGAAHSFPDRHNRGGKGRGQRTSNLPAKPPQSQQSPTPPQSSPQQQYQQYPPFPPAQPPQRQVSNPPNQQTYQFQGYTFQHGNPQPTQAQAHQSQYYQAFQQSPLGPPPQQSPGAAQFPAGAYVNPAFWAGQQQQPHVQPQQYGGWNGQTPPQQYPQSQGRGEGQPDLAAVLRALGSQGQGHGQQ